MEKVSEIIPNTIQQVNSAELEKQSLITDEDEEQIKMKISDIIPAKYVNLEYDKDYVNGLINKSLYIHGNVGVGKTVLMASIAKQYIRMYRVIQWVNYPALIMRLYRGFSTDNNSAEIEVKEMAEYGHILFIDDLGAEKLSDFTRQMTYYIINEREQRTHRTIITSNFSLEKIDEQIDCRISSRIAGMCEIIELKGKDQRING